ncbi:MAG: 16S rRNA (uracil(1498)-N(3))-methyltransferase [Oscillospiraceae bacterium]|nr:16S rRNA (uracil(1498)-N(3))-methyltransferase [Oscillospiraceae bacterium]MBQ4538946.1 16S rRNA (uracil(1498)-N(3))-methyltransferase [Oscillospiraceae bacterium]
MPRFFVDQLSPLTVVTGDNARHISKSLRMKAGETLTLCDGRGTEAEGVIESLSADAVSVRLGQTVPTAAEPETKVSLYLAMPKGDKAELVIQKSVELGVHEIVFLLTSRCISRPKPQEFSKKQARFQKIADEAAGQCGRGILPQVRGLLSFEQTLEEMQQFDSCFTLYEGECPSFRASLPKRGERTALLIGSEGGFAPDEIEKAKSAGVLPVSLGKRILRCETAPIAALSALMFALGEMD